MENRINRKGDESLYQPKIHSERIRLLYNLKQLTGKPMTVLLDKAIHDMAQSYGVEFPQEEPIEIAPSIETWEEICEYRAFLNQLDFLDFLSQSEKIKQNE